MQTITNYHNYKRTTTKFQLCGTAFMKFRITLKFGLHSVLRTNQCHKSRSPCTFFQHRDVQKYTWYRPSMAQKSLIDFCIVSSDLFSKVLDVQVKRGVEMSTDHHLIVCSPRFPKPWLNTKLCRSSVA